MHAWLPWPALSQRGEVAPASWSELAWQVATLANRVSRRPKSERRRIRRRWMSLESWMPGRAPRPATAPYRVAADHFPAAAAPAGCQASAARRAVAPAHRPRRARRQPLPQRRQQPPSHPPPPLPSRSRRVRTCWAVVGRGVPSVFERLPLHWLQWTMGSRSRSRATAPRMLCGAVASVSREAIQRRQWQARIALARGELMPDLLEGAAPWL